MFHNVLSPNRLPNELALLRKIIDTPTYVAVIYELVVAIVVTRYRPRSLTKGTNAVKVQVALLHHWPTPTLHNRRTIQL